MLSVKNTHSSTLFIPFLQISINGTNILNKSDEKIKIQNAFPDDKGFNTLSLTGLL
jgi:hypothetical protein